MARAITWAIRVTLADGREVFLRQGGLTGGGSIATFYSKEKADAQAAFLLKQRGVSPRPMAIRVIERSHGRREP